MVKNIARSLEKWLNKDSKKGLEGVCYNSKLWLSLLGDCNLEWTCSDAWDVAPSLCFLLTPCDQSWSDGLVMEMPINTALRDSAAI